MTDKNAIPGIVVATLPAAKFTVETEDGRRIWCTLSGKMNMNHIHIVIGDRVTIVLSPDGKIGRINRRL